MNSELISYFIKFCVVGGSGVVIDFAITYLCKEKLKFNKYLSNSLGFIIAATSNYLLNRWWTFHSVEADISIQYAKFIGIALIGLLINNGIIYILNDKLKLNFYLSKLLAIGVVTLWNFAMNYLFTF